MKISRAYGGVTLMCSLITGNCLVNSDFERLNRLYSFDHEYLELKFEDMHQREVGDDVANLGYPDDGNGRYMKERPYSDWYFMNVAKRIYRNDIEHIVTMIPMSLLNGIVYPYSTIGLLAVYFIGRSLYTNGYFEKEGAENKKRMVGSLLCNFAHVGTFGVTMMIALNMSRGRIMLSKFLT